MGGRPGGDGGLRAQDGVVQITHGGRFVVIVQSMKNGTTSIVGIICVIVNYKLRPIILQVVSSTTVSEIDIVSSINS